MLQRPSRLPDDRWIRKFLTHLATDRGASVYTQRNYRQALLEFFHWHQDEQSAFADQSASARQAVAWENLQRDDFRGYLRFLGRQNLGRAAIQLRFCALRTFYKFLIRHGVAGASPIKNLALPKQGRRLPKYLTKQQMLDLLGAPLKLMATPRRKGPGRPISASVCLRDVAVLETIYSCGLRVSELCGLRVEDIDWSEQLVRVRGKGKKERLVPIGETALKTIESYWSTLKLPPSGAVTGVFRGNEKGRAAATGSIVPPLETISGHCRAGSRPDPAQVAAQLRDAPAGCGRGFAERAGIARPRASRHDAGLHPRHHRAVEESLRRRASAGVGIDRS